MVHIAWEDPSGVTQDWTPVKELIAVKPVPCISQGTLISMARDTITVLPHFFADGSAGCGEMVIPRSAIKECWTFKPDQDVTVRMKRKGGRLPVKKGKK